MANGYYRFRSSRKMARSATTGHSASSPKAAAHRSTPARAVARQPR